MIEAYRLDIKDARGKVPGAYMEWKRYETSTRIYIWMKSLLEVCVEPPDSLQESRLLRKHLFRIGRIVRLQI